MRPATASAHALFISFLTMMGVAACTHDVERRSIAEPQALGPRSSVEYTCGGQTPESVCLKFHGPTSVPTGWCGPGYGSCFEMSYGAESRAVMADDQGDFPRTLFIWSEGSLTGGNACTLTTQGNKTRIDLNDGYVRSAPRLTTAGHYYFEHFASDRASGCLAWIECKIY